MPQHSQDLNDLAVTTIKMLAVDAVEKANSGHPGGPMGMADYAFLLWNRTLRYSAQDPHWPNRDRFVLSAGHASMLIYALLHLAGFDLPLEELKAFRQLGSKTPGHPEVGVTPGVETTTGPLGQGFANAVGMGLAAKMMAARFNRDDFSPIDHNVYAIVSDGDLMEGITSEAASLAGHLKLGNLIFIYDDNKISIDGSTSITFSEDVGRRFDAYGWHTQRIDGHDHHEIMKAFQTAGAETGRPSLILARTHIAKGSPNKHDSASSHGAPLGADEVSATKKALGWPEEPTFHVPEEVRSVFAQRTEELENERKNWEKKLEQWKKNHPDLSQEWDRYWSGDVPLDLYDRLLASLPDMPNATRSISGTLQQVVAKNMPSLVGGSADLDGSTKTYLKDASSITAEDFSGRNIHFGIREHAMGAICNGMALYGSWIPFGATFLQFADYVRPSIRLAALSKLRTLFVFTHDSFFLGEDGPTHQPIEHVSALRLIPNLAVVRPADAMECAAAWTIALSREHGPTAFALTRQKLPAVTRDSEVTKNDLLRGGYIVADAPGGKPNLIIIASGSELHLAMEARKALNEKGTATRVVSMLCEERFAIQPEGYRDKVIPRSGSKFVAIEAGCRDLWHKYVGRAGLVIGIDRFGESAPDQVLAEKFGFTAPAVIERITTWLNA